MANDFAGAAPPERPTELLREDHPSYAGRGTAAVNAMRAALVEQLAAGGLPESALPFVLEEIETGTDPRLLAVACRALRASGDPRPHFARLILGAIGRLRYRDLPVAGPDGETTVVAELLGALAWAAPGAGPWRGEIEILRDSLPKRYRGAVEEALARVGGGEMPDGACCSLGFREWRAGRRKSAAAVDSVRFEDQDGRALSFRELFTGQPSVVAFFYTRCDNPLKCSLTIANLGAVQRILAERGLSGRIRTAAITYDPGFDLPSRLRTYAVERGFRPGPGGRVLRAPEDFGLLREHFGLGVNFVGSVVNRHRIELFLLDGHGRVAAAFERLRWDPGEVVDRAAALLRNGRATLHASRIPAALAAAGSLALALLPKCPACWAAYLGMLGIAGAGVSTWAAFPPVLIGFVLLNAAAVLLRARVNGRVGAAITVAAGAVLMVGWRSGLFEPGVREAAIALTCVGSGWSVLPAKRNALRKGRHKRDGVADAACSSPTSGNRRSA